VSACEKCWEDAYLIMRSTGVSQEIAYERLLADRKDNPCTPKEQAGQFWDDTLKMDRRDKESGK
jgi:hypothetical protein